jgi:predicted ATPase
MSTPDDSAAIKTPDQRVRVFVSSTLQELAEERIAVRRAIEQLRLTPVMFELGARPHPPRELYKAYIEQSHVFVGIYWERYGWVADGMEISGLEDEWNLAGEMPKLVYVKRPADRREEGLSKLLSSIQRAGVSYKSFATAEELAELLADDLAIVLSERFDDAVQTSRRRSGPPSRILPTPATPLFGRESDIERCAGLLLDPNVRMVTLVGPGGIGKTRLAIEVAKRLEDHFADGVCYLSLASLQDPELLPNEIMNQVVGKGIPTASPMTTIITTLRNQCLLIVLDNFEHLLPGAKYVSELIESCPELNLLVTSRAALQIKPEHEFAVAPLDLPGEHLQHSSFEEIGQFSSIKLFVDRAQAVRPDFALTSENADLVRKICMRLEGIPLAIELAAARMKTLNLQSMIGLLEKGLDVLSGGLRDAPDRQKTLRATIQWSYDLLTPEEKQVLNRICVFRGGATLECSFLVAGSNDSLSLSELTRRSMYPVEASIAEPIKCAPTVEFISILDSLVAKSLLRVDFATSDEQRYTAYEAVREFCLEELRISGSIDDIQVRHSLAIASCIENEWPKLWGPATTKTYSYFDREIDNIRSALATSVRHSPELAMRLAIATGEYWDVRQLHESTDWLSKILDLADSAGHGDSRLYQLTKMEFTRRLFRLERWQEMFAFVDEIEIWARANNDDFLLLDAIQQRTMALAYAAKRDIVEHQVNSALPIAQRVGYKFIEMCLIQNLGATEAFDGSPDRAKELLEKSITLAKDLVAIRRMGISYTVLALVHAHLGDAKTAIKNIENVLEQIRLVGDHVLLLYNLTCLSVIAIHYGEYEKALHISGTARRYSEFSGVGFVPVAERDVAVAEKTAISHVGDERAREIFRATKVTSLSEAIGEADAICKDFSLRSLPSHSDSDDARYSAE